MYQIFTERFYNGDPTNDVEDREYIYIGEGTPGYGTGISFPLIWASGNSTGEIFRSYG